MCSSFVRIEGRCRTRRHPPGVILKSSVSPSVSYFTVARPRTAHALPHSRPPPACHARLLPAAPRVKHKFQREYSATRSRGRLNYIASEVVLSPGFSPSMQGDPCRSLPFYCRRGWDCVRQLGVVGAGAWRGLGHGLGGSASSPIIIRRLPFVSPLLPIPV